jgi:tetratricopeptide (TPR) repeat protein
MSDWDDAERRAERAQEFFEQRKWPEALEELRAAISINPYNSAWFFNIGLTLDEMGRFEEAIEAYRQSLKIEEDDPQAMLHLGIDLRRVGKLDQALRVLERIEQIDNTFEPAYCERVLTYAEMGDHEKAEEMFYLARLYKEHCSDCYDHIGRSLAMRGLYDKAIYCWQKALDSGDAAPHVHVRIAEALWQKGELEHARQHFLIGLRQDPGDIDTLLELGRLLIEMGRLDEAGEKIRRAIEMAPEEPAAHFCHGEWLVGHGEHDEQAAGAFAQTLRLDPTFPAAHLRLAEIHHRRGERDEAREHLRQEIQLGPQDVRTLLELANLLIECDQTTEAMACLKRATKLAPTNVRAWQDLAITQFVLGRYDDGIKSCREALKHDAANVMVMYNLAVAHEHLRQYDDALAWIEQAMLRDPNDASLRRLEFRVRVMRTGQKTLGVLRSLLRWR